MKKQVLITSIAILIMLVATFSSIATSIDGDILTEKSKDTLTILETALSNPDDVTLEELMAVEGVIHDLKIQKIEDTVPWNPGNGICLVFELIGGGAYSMFEYYYALFNTSFIQDFLGCDNNPENCEGFVDGLMKLLDVTIYFNDLYDEYDCDNLNGNQEAQSVPLAGGSNAAGSSSCPCSSDTSQQLIQDDFKQDLNR